MEQVTTSIPGSGHELHGIPGPADGGLTEALADLAEGRCGAAERVMPLVYARLHALAESSLRDQPAGHTLQSTALVNEVYLKLLGGNGTPWESRAHFFAVAAKAMRQVLVDHARTKNRQKRGGGRRRIPLSAVQAEAPLDLDLAELDEAIQRLAVVNSVGARVTEMRFFGGMPVEDIAAVLGMTDRTVRRHWVLAKAWLCRELTGGAGA
jgi:RNA polymerase sigma-70 factor (ECF subfamily)